MKNVSGTVVHPVEIDPFFGLVAPLQGWVPPLRYLLRRTRILSLFETIAQTNLLEVGCGAGALLVDFSLHGFACTGLEPSTSAAVIARRLASIAGENYRVVTEPDLNWAGFFGVVCALDVLEHVEDDDATLAQWCSWLRPGGKLVISVPAHKDRWGPGDVWAGHYRRYDHAPFQKLLLSQGLRIEHFECYGFPLANITEWVGKRTYRRLLAQRNSDTRPEVASAESGIQRDAYLKNFHTIDSVAGRFALRVNYVLQRMALKTNLGSGYLVLATKL